MKSRIGTINKKPIVQGDKNLVTPNEIHVSELKGGGSSTVNNKEYYLYAVYETMRTHRCNNHTTIQLGTFKMDGVPKEFTISKRAMGGGFEKLSNITVLTKPTDIPLTEVTDCPTNTIQNNIFKIYNNDIEAPNINIEIAYNYPELPWLTKFAGSVITVIYAMGSAEGSAEGPLKIENINTPITFSVSDNSPLTKITITVVD